MLTKADFLLRPDIHFLNHGSFGACARIVLDEQRRWIDRMEEQPVLFFRDAPELMKHARGLVAKHINAADADDLVFVTNSSYAVNVAAHAASNWLHRGDEVVTTDHEYGACDYAWSDHLKRTRAVIKRARIPMPVPSMDEIEELVWAEVTERTKVLFLSHITSPTGVLFPIERLCARAREHGIITIIDGAHGIGQLDLDMEAIGADLYTSNVHKWMCAPKGCAFMWIRPEVQHLFPPLITSWGLKMVMPDARPLVLAHEYVGTRDMSPFLTVPFLFEWMKENDWPSVQSRSHALVDYGMKLMSDIDGVRLMSETNPALQMFTLVLPEKTDTVELKETLYNEHNIEVVVQPWLDTPTLRVSAHAHTSASDIDALHSALIHYLS